LCALPDEELRTLKVVLVGQEREGTPIGGAKDREVTPVESEDGIDPFALCEPHQGRI
jgi:hypothetical protein